ncbi:unnamed protein product [Rangifer tarandus platyrhynchus]|uniref:Uncharacterized protein n=2 Tax=Rangifer tarandus platyrhynchus TaxID=3082113 RepID=A0ABN8ZLY3_RANTA|nr:unnamed protein product [Rangifer tarandus platyrhynchus]CAI9708307.1 unnamed protein product [Rangifer tarandus platyrhynchus]
MLSRLRQAFSRVYGALLVIVYTYRDTVLVVAEDALASVFSLASEAGADRSPWGAPSSRSLSPVLSLRLRQTPGEPQAPRALAPPLERAFQARGPPALLGSSVRGQHHGGCGALRSSGGEMTPRL